MTAKYECKACRKLQKLGRKTGQKRERCIGCQIFDSTERYAGERRKRRGKGLETLDDEERDLVDRLRQARAKDDLAAVSNLQQQIDQLKKTRRQASKRVVEPYLGFTRQQFLHWRQKPANRRCHFCRITDAAALSLASAEERGSRTQPFVGIDRIDYEKPYTLTNIVACCERCDAMRSKPSSFTVAELRLLGPALKKLWQARLSKTS